MKQERNKNIILELQIAIMKQTIHDGKGTYPIEIFETRKIDDIIYHELGPVKDDPSSWYERAAQIGTDKHNELGVMSIQKNRTTPEKTVYLVDIHTDDKNKTNIGYSNCSGELFIEEAENQKLAMSIETFQMKINFGQLSTENKFIRFI